MSPFVFVLWIIFMCCATAVTLALLSGLGGRRRSQKAEAKLRADWAQSTAALREEVNALRARVATLEKIVTDPAAQLTTEIERLR